MSNSNYTGYGTLTANGNTDSVSVSRQATLSATTSGGTAGTLAWQFLGPNGVWTPIMKADGTTAMAGSVNSMYTADFGGNVSVRGVLTGSTGATWVWQIVSSSMNNI
jgi:hypothetical protein